MRPTVPTGDDVNRNLTFFGLDPRMEIGHLNQLFADFCYQSKDAAIGKQLARYCQEAIDGQIFVIPQAAGALAHGITRIPALSIAVVRLHIHANIGDLNRVVGTLNVVRELPGVPQALSLYRLLHRSPTFKFTPWHKFLLEPIGALWIQSHRPMYCNDRQYTGTVLYHFMREENRIEECFMGTEGAFDAGLVDMPAHIGANMGHLGGGGNPVQQQAAAQQFFTEVTQGVGDTDLLSKCLDEYQRFVSLLMKHTDFTPISLPVDGGDIPARSVTYKEHEGTFQCYSLLDKHSVDPTIGEIGTMFFQAHRSDPAPRPGPPAPRYNWFPIVPLADRTVATQIMIRSTNDVPINWGLNANIISSRVQGTQVICDIDSPELLQLTAAIE